MQFKSDPGTPCVFFDEWNIEHSTTKIEYFYVSRQNARNLHTPSRKHHYSIKQVYRGIYYVLVVRILNLADAREFRDRSLPNEA